MISSLGHRTRPTNTDAVLRMLAPIVDRSGIVQTLEGAAAPKSAAGAPARYGRYTARGVLIAMFHAAYAGRPASLAELCALIWCDYTDEQLEFIGLSGLRTPERATAMLADAKAWRNEHQRLWQYLQELFEPIDDTPRTAQRRVTQDEAKAAAKRAKKKLREKAALRRKVLNDLIVHTIDPDLLADWKGDLAIDEHVVHVSKSKTSYFRDEHTMVTATPMAAWYHNQRRVGAGWSVGLTRAVATSRPNGKRVPTVCVALDINGSSPGSAQAAKRCLDQFSTSPIRPAKNPNDRVHLVTDQAYSFQNEFNADVLERGYTLLMNCRKKAKNLQRDIGRLLDPDAEVPGPYLYRGVFLCPAAHQIVKQPPIGRPRPGDSKEHRARYEEQQQLLRQFEMPTNGLPVVTINRGPGRPSSDINNETDQRVVKVRVKCPAAAGKVRCPIRGTEAWFDPKNQNKPSIGQSAPVDNWPVVCDKANTTITMTPHEFKQYQPVMESSWEHEDWMSCNRSRDEGFNSVLVSNEGGNLQDRSLYARRNPMLCLTIAFAVGRANLKIQEAWRATLQSHHGVAPDEPRAGRNRSAADGTAA